MRRSEDDIVNSLLGAVIAPLHRAEADSLEMPGSGAVLIVRVDEGKAADRSGLKAGDIIVSINDEGLRGSQPLGDFATSIGRELQRGRRAIIWIGVQRERERRELPITFLSFS